MKVNPGSKPASREDSLQRATDCVPCEDASYEANLPASLSHIHDCDNCFPSRAHCIARW